jgi:putative membrane protein
VKQSDIKLNNMKTKIFLISILMVVLAISCKKDERMNETDEQFLKTAAQGNYNEIDAGQLAASKAVDSMVRNFGNRMVTDHQAALAELQSLAQDKDVTLPTGPDAAHLAAKQQLLNMSGWKFDSTYIHMQVTDHQTTINLFQNELNNGKNKAVKNYADKYLPIIKTHFNMADNISDRF